MSGEKLAPHRRQAGRRTQRSRQRNLRGGWQKTGRGEITLGRKVGGGGGTGMATVNGRPPCAWAVAEKSNQWLAARTLVTAHDDPVGRWLILVPESAGSDVSSQVTTP